jgi:hypothetical protein
MPSETFLSGVVKIHINCGGQVRFVEDLDQPGVEFTGECLYCETTSIPVENCIYIYEDDLPGDLTKHDIVETPATDLAELHWSETWRSYGDAVEGGLLEQIEMVVA